MKKTLAIVLALSMVLALAGCGGSSSAPAAPSQTTSSGAAEPAAPSASGELNVYTTVSDLQYNAIMGAFSAKYPSIQINYVQAGAGESKTRIQAEASNPQADVMFGGLVYADTLTHGQYFESYICVNDSKMPAEFQNATGVLTYHDTQIPCLWVNDELEKEAGVTIKGYEDLLAPSLKGLICSADPTGSSSAWNQLQCLLTDFGGWSSDEAWDFIDRLMDNLVITEGSSAVYKGVYNGEYAVGLTYEPACVQMLSEGAEGVHIVYPEEGVTSIAFGSAIIKGCKNLDNAKLFMDFLQSDEGQALYLQSGARPATSAKLDVVNEWIVDLSTINYLQADTQALAENRETIFSRWNELWAKH